MGSAKGQFTWNPTFSHPTGRGWSLSGEFKDKYGTTRLEGTCKETACDLKASYTEGKLAGHSYTWTAHFSSSSPTPEKDVDLFRGDWKDDKREGSGTWSAKLECNKVVDGSPPAPSTPAPVHKTKEDTAYLEPLKQDMMNLCAGWSVSMPGSSGRDELKKDPSRAFIWLDEGAECLKLADKFLADGHDPDTMVGYNAWGVCPPEEKVRLADVKVRVCQPALDALKKNLAEFQAVIDAKWEPYMKLLSGDKLALFKSEVKESNRGFWGPGRKKLESPKDFANASAWYIESGDTDTAGTYHYSIHGWQFSGMKARVYHKDGTTSGGNPPPSAYP